MIQDITDKLLWKIYKNSSTLCGAISNDLEWPLNTPNYPIFYIFVAIFIFVTV